MAEKKSSVEATLKNIRRNTRKKYSAEEKIRIVLEGLRGDLPIAELCLREGINQNSYYKCSKEFLEAGKQRLGVLVLIVIGIPGSAVRIRKQGAWLQRKRHPLGCLFIKKVAGLGFRQSHERSERENQGPSGYTAPYRRGTVRVLVLKHGPWTVRQGF